MKFKIGFSSNTENENNELDSPLVTEGESVRAIKSVVNVLFEDGRTLPYYNDSFVLKEGDCVFVDGKLAGKRGKVTDVTTKFKVNLEYYKRVIAKLNFDFHGEFVNVNHFMISFGDKVLPFEQVKGWYFPPKESPTNFFEGEGYIFDFNSNEYEFSADTLQKAMDSLMDGELKYLSVVGGVGRAIIGKNNMHIVEFNFDYAAGVVSDIYCDCFTFGFCSHSVAVCVALHKLMKDERFDEEKSFCALDLNTFYKIAIENVKKITL